MLLIGLTGGIASGKTLVSDRFATLGAAVVDADVVAREVVEPGSDGLKAVIDAFGKGLLDDKGALNRTELRQRVFTDNTARETLNAILHPRIREASEQQLQAYANAGHSYAVYAVPLLVETQQQERFDRILVVDVPESVQLDRLMARDDIDASSAQRILDTQATRQQRLAVADDVVVNTGSVAETLAQVDKLHHTYSNLAD